MKYSPDVAQDFLTESLPSWERGLKWNRCRNGWRMVLSLPSWERGLKLHLFTFILSNLYVAPLVGAWIEIVGRKTEKIFRKSSLPSWERGLKYLLTRFHAPSLPSWERGLKYFWENITTIFHRSLPSWERGLKYGR